MKKFIFALALLIPICVLCAEDVSAQSSAYSTKRLRLKGQAVPPTPNPPTGQYNIWVDSATGALNITDSAGTDTPVGAGLSGLTTGTLPVATSSTAIGDSILLQTGVVSIAVNGSDAATNTVTDALILRHQTSGTAIASFGTGLLFQGESDVAVNSDMGAIRAVWQTAPDATRDGDLRFFAVQDGTLTHVASLTSNKGLSGIDGLEFPGSAYVASGGVLSIEGTGDIGFETNGVGRRWTISSATGHFAPGTTNTYDIGTSSAFVRNNYVSTSIQGTRTQAITDNAAAATFVTIAVPTSNTTVGGRIFYTITAIDAGTAIQTKTGTYSFGLNNIGGTVTGAGTDVLEHSQLSVGTLAPTFSVNISGTNAQFQLVLDTSLDAGAETLKIEYRVQIDSGTATVTPAT